MTKYSCYVVDCKWSKKAHFRVPKNDHGMPAGLHCCIHHHPALRPSLNEQAKIREKIRSLEELFQAARKKEFTARALLKKKLRDADPLAKAAYEAGTLKREAYKAAKQAALDESVRQVRKDRDDRKEAARMRLAKADYELGKALNPLPGDKRPSRPKLPKPTHPGNTSKGLKH